jgi:hypothetical protein
MSMGVKLAALAGTGTGSDRRIGAGKFGPMFRRHGAPAFFVPGPGSITIATAPARRSRPSDGRGGVDIIR